MSVSEDSNKAMAAVPDLEFDNPKCPGCRIPVDTDGGGFWCDRCALVWDMDGEGGARTQASSGEAAGRCWFRHQWVDQGFGRLCVHCERIDVYIDQD